jgi:hypothetical protein
MHALRRIPSHHTINPPAYIRHRFRHPLLATSMLVRGNHRLQREDSPIVHHRDNPVHSFLHRATRDLPRTQVLDRTLTIRPRDKAISARLNPAKALFYRHSRASRRWGHHRHNKLMCRPYVTTMGILNQGSIAKPAARGMPLAQPMSPAPTRLISTRKKENYQTPVLLPH